MHVMVIPAIKLGVKGATAMGLGRVVGGVVMTNTPIDTKAQLFFVRVATIGLTSLLTKHVGDHMDEQIDVIVDAVKNRDKHIQIVMEKKDEVVEAAKDELRDVVQDDQPNFPFTPPSDTQN